MTYKDVVEKAKRTLKERGHYGTKDVDLYACDLWLDGNQINLWSYWQGYQLADIDQGIDILLVGQDWGNPEWDKDVAGRIKRIQSGENVLYCDGNLSPTDTNLITLLRFWDVISKALIRVRGSFSLTIVWGIEVESRAEA